MGSDFKSIPIIDISPLLDKIDDPKMVEDKELLEVVRLLDKACKEAGFFYVKGHGIPESLVKEVRDITHGFFALPCEDKVKIKMTSESGYRGYQRVGENVTKGKPDMHEAIDCYRPLEPGSFGDLAKPLEGPNLWPDHPSNFKETMEEYIGLVRDLSRKIMRGIALALGGPVDALEGERAGDSFWVMRLIGYPVSTDIPEEELTDTGWYRNALNKFIVNLFLKLKIEKILNTFSRLFSCILLHQNLVELIQIMVSIIILKLSCNQCFMLSVVDSLSNFDAFHGRDCNFSLSRSHDMICDTGLLTLVNQDDDICALEVRNRSGEWIYAAPIPGTFVCNIGDMLKVWSNGLYEPTLHRVVNNSPKYRVSVVFFYEPNFDTAVEPLEFCKRKTGGIVKYEKVVYGEHLVRKVLTNFVV